MRAAEEAAAEEAAGAGLIEFGLVVTATASDADELRTAHAEIANLAASSRLRLRVAKGQQAAAFATAPPAMLAGCRLETDVRFGWQPGSEK